MLESVNLAEINKKASYHLLLEKITVQVEQIAVGAFSWVLELEHFHSEGD